MTDKTLVLTLSNPTDNTDTLDLKIAVNNTKVADRWFSQVCKCLDNKLHLEKNFCWLGWPDPFRNIQFLKNRLQLCVDRINLYSAFSSTKWKNYRIEEEWTDIGSPDALNKLHHHFEILMGQVWNVSEYIKSADDEIKYEIRQLNNLVHELQSRQNVDGLSVNSIYGMTIASYLNVERELFDDDFYDCFSHKREFGEVYLHYSQTGKTPIEAYADRDDDVFDDNINALRFVSGEYNIWWGEPHSDNEVAMIKNNVREYLNSRNLIKTEGPEFNYYVDSLGNKQGIGYMPVAKIINTYNTNAELKQEVLNRLNITKLTAYSGSSMIASNSWDYSWNDADYELSEIEILKPYFPR